MTRADKNNRPVVDAAQQRAQRVAGAGALLLSQRERLGLSEVAVAESLKLTVSRLRSIESDAYTNLPSETYIRGYLRNYARLLNLDELVVLQAYDAERTGDDGGDVVSRGVSTLGCKLNGKFSDKRYRVVYLVLMVFVLLCVIAYHLFSGQYGLESDDLLLGSSGPDISGSDISKPSVSEPHISKPHISKPHISKPHISKPHISKPHISKPHISKPHAISPHSIEAAPETIALEVGSGAGIEVGLPVSPNDHQQGEKNTVDGSVEPEPLPAGVVNTGIVDNNEGVDSHSNSSFSEEAMLVSKVTAAELLGNAVESGRANAEPVIAEVSTAIEPAKENTLKFSFENKCWIKVTDADGKVLFVGLKEPSSQLSLSGKAPFQLVVGNVVGTSLMYNGEPVRLSTKGNSNLARLQVGG